MTGDEVDAASADTQRELDYVNAIIAYVADDVRIVQLRVVAALSVAVLFLTQLPFERLLDLEDWSKGLLIGGLAAVAGAAISYFSYLAALHHSRIKLAKCLLTLDTDEARCLSALKGKTYKEDGWKLDLADRLFVIGGAMLAAVVVTMLW